MYTCIYLYLVPCLCTVVQTVRYKMHTAQACVKKKPWDLHNFLKKLFEWFWHSDKKYNKCTGYNSNLMLLSLTNNFPCVCALLFYVCVCTKCFILEVFIKWKFYYYFAHTEFLSVNFGKGKIHLGELFFFIIIYVPFFVREKFSLVFSKLKI